MTTQPPLCIYHSNCYDGFTAAWAVRRALGDAVEFVAANYGMDPPDVTGRDVIIVDFSYKADVLAQMAHTARTILILDHHKTAAQDLAALPMPPTGAYDPAAMIEAAQLLDAPFPIFAIFDMERSGAGLAWDYFHPGEPRPALIDYVEDRDLWRFALPASRQISANLHSYDFAFGTWTEIALHLEEPALRSLFAETGAALERRHHKDIDETIRSVKRRMRIGGFDVPVANVPYAWSSDAGNKMAQGEPFAACYVDTPQGRSFSLRSTDAGEDVSAIARLYGGGGHRNAAGFKMPAGWEGEKEEEEEIERCCMCDRIVGDQEPRLGTSEGEIICEACAPTMAEHAEHLIDSGEYEPERVTIGLLWKQEIEAGTRDPNAKAVHPSPHLPPKAAA